MNHHATDNLTGHRNLALAVIASALKAYAKAKPGPAGEERRQDERAFLAEEDSTWYQLAQVDPNWVRDVLREVDAGELTYRPARGDTLAGDPI